MALNPKKQQFLNFFKERNKENHSISWWPELIMLNVWMLFQKEHADIGHHQKTAVDIRPCWRCTRPLRYMTPLDMCMNKRKVSTDIWDLSEAHLKMHIKFLTGVHCWLCGLYEKPKLWCMKRNWFLISYNKRHRGLFAWLTLRNMGSWIGEVSNGSRNINLYIWK